VLEVLLGGGITLAVALVFHLIASHSLGEQASALMESASRSERLVEKVLAGLEEARLVDLVRKDGKITGIVKQGKVDI